MAPFANFIGPSYTALSPNSAIERLINRYPEVMESPGAKSRLVYNPCSGLTAFGSVSGAVSVPALYTINGRTFSAGSGQFGEVAISGAVTNLGSMASDPLRPTFGCSGDAGGEVAVASGGKLYVLTLSTNAFALATNNVNVVGYLNSTFYGLDTVNSILRASNPLDGFTWPGGAVTLRESAPDRWQSMIIVNGHVWVFGSETSDVFYDAGLSPFPLALQATIPVGIAAADSAAVLDSAPAWLAKTSQGAGIVVHATNGPAPPTRISTHAVEAAIASYSTITDAQAFTYQELGHTFYVLRFPTARACWVYDVATQLWHERLYWNRTLGEWQAYRPACHVYAFDRHLVGDANSGSIYSLSPTVSTDADGNGIRWLRRAPHVVNEQKWIFYDHLQLDLEVGLGLATGQGSDPKLMLRVSRDAGKTYGNELWTNAGMIGEYKTRAIWSRLGRARDAVFEVSASDPIPYRIAAAYLDVRMGRF